MHVDADYDVQDGALPCEHGNWNDLVGSLGKGQQAQPTFQVADDSTKSAKAGNGEIVAVGEAYDTPASAKDGCAAVQRAADGASVVEADS